MEHSGKAFQSALKWVGWSLLLLLAILAAGVIAHFLGNLIAALTATLIATWGILACLVFYVLRDPDPVVPSGRARMVVAPAQGEVISVEASQEAQILQGPCQRVTIRPRWWDVQVSKSPVAGMVTYSVVQDLAHVEGGELVKGEVLSMGMVPQDRADLVVGVRWVAGLFPREAVAFCKAGDAVELGGRLGLMQVGTRCELYLPPGVEIHVKGGDRVRGGETVIATLPERRA